MASPYRSPTKRLAAEVLLDDGVRVTGDLHLHPNTLAPGGFESALTMMNNDESFFPISENGGTVVLVGKGRTVSVTYPVSTAAAPPEPAVGEGPVPLAVHLSDGRKLSGWVVLELPSAYPRTLDFLNGSGTFLPIHDETLIHLVNRAHIRTVHPLD